MGYIVCLLIGGIAGVIATFKLAPNVKKTVTTNNNTTTMEWNFKSTI